MSMSIDSPDLDVALTWKDNPSTAGNSDQKFPAYVLEDLSKNFNISIKYRSELTPVILANVCNSEFRRIEVYLDSHFDQKAEISLFS
jgi:hypothetical protein